MNKFNLNQLRTDVLIHADLPTTPDFCKSSFWQEQWIDWMLIQLIGYDSYILLHSTPDAKICFRPDGKTHLSMYHSFS